MDWAGSLIPARPVEDEEALVRVNYGLAVVVARRRFNRVLRSAGYDLDDVVQVALIGLIRGLRTFDESKDSALASWLYANACFAVGWATKFCGRAKRGATVTHASLDADVSPAVARPLGDVVPAPTPHRCEAEAHEDEEWLTAAEGTLGASESGARMLRILRRIVVDAEVGREIAKAECISRQRACQIAEEAKHEMRWLLLSARNGNEE
jgi:DNA-directed RNA polymerase specialized sigma24 family protein